MKKMKRTFSLLLTVTARRGFVAAAGALMLMTLSFLSTPALADLTGSEVTANLYFPTFGTVFSCCGATGTAGPTLVGPGGVDFTTIASDGTLQVTGTQIIWTATLPEVYWTGAFNGFDLKFSGALTIINVTLDPASTLAPVGFSFTGNHVRFNLSGLTANTGQKVILDVETVQSYPLYCQGPLTTIGNSTAFQWASVGAGSAPPGPGQCAWADRGPRGSEVYVTVIFGPLGAVANLPPGRFAEIGVHRDTIRNQLDVDQVVGFVSPPFSSSPTLP